MDFMLKGLQELENEAEKYNIPFFLLTGNPEQEITKFIKEQIRSVILFQILIR